MVFLVGFEMNIVKIENYFEFFMLVKYLKLIIGLSLRVKL